MYRWLQLVILYQVKILSRLFYRFKVKWLTPISQKEWKDVKLIVFLNHTSLFEPVFLGIAPHSLMRNLTKFLHVPAADTTLERPIVGRLLKTLIPGCYPITRKRDASWQHYLNAINKESIVAILPEGRMKRPTGLDKNGQPMTIKKGIAEIMNKMTSGKMLVVYSGGLHHIQTPGSTTVNLFKSVTAALECLDISDFKQKLIATKGDKSLSQAIIDAFESKLKYCKQLEALN